ncbi:MAG: hypothetical protein QME76_05990 [Bacillota bacterium]|nr:hypothetical protein [Bacillota bacterium]
MFDGLTAFFMESYTNSVYGYGLLVLALVVGCAAGLGALTEFVTHRLNARRGR